MTRLPEDMDAALRRVQVEPRASLEPEIAGRFAAGERARQAAGDRGQRRLWAGVAVAVVLVVAGAAVRGGYVPALDAFAVTHTTDRCCEDLDGVGGVDDGVLVETTGRNRIRRLMVYEEHDVDRAWSPGELVRFTRRGAPTVGTPGLGPLVTRTFCCKDYDGGGAPDDGLLVVASATGDVLMAALFERGRSSDHFVLR